jgi:hypothetical protein
MISLVGVRGDVEVVEDRESSLERRDPKAGAEETSRNERDAGDKEGEGMEKSGSTSMKTEGVRVERRLVPACTV